MQDQPIRTGQGQSMADDDYRTLRRGLVGTHGELYRTSAVFKASIDNLTQLLPLWIDGIADEALVSDERLATAVALASDCRCQDTEPHPVTVDGPYQCTHGMPTPASCVDCMDEVGLGSPPTPPVTVEAAVSAKRDGNCGCCDRWISVGEPIVLLSTGQWVTERCAVETLGR